MSLPLPTYYLDIETGGLRLGLGGPPVGHLTFTQGDVFALPLGFSNGTTDIGATLTAAGTATITAAVKAVAGGTLLASASTYTYSAGISSIALSLNTVELAAYLAADVPGVTARFQLEIRVTLASDTVAYFCAPITIRRSMLDNSDPAPTSAARTYARRAEVRFWAGSGVSTAAGLRALPTATATDWALPVGALVSYFDSAANSAGSGDTTGAVVTYRVAAGTAADAAPWVLRPNDYAASNQINLILVEVHKGGSPVFWNGTTAKFHGTVAVGAAGAVSLAPDQAGFTLA